MKKLVMIVVAVALVLGGCSTSSSTSNTQVSNPTYQQAVCKKLKKCLHCHKTISGEYFTIHLEDRGKKITVLYDGVLCKKCGTKVAGGLQ